MLRWLGKIRGDSVVAWDLRERRLTYYDASLEFSRTEPLRPATPYVLVGAFPRGKLLIWPIAVVTRPFQPGEVVADSSAVALTRPGSTELDTVARVAAQPSYVTESRTLARLPLTVSPAFAVADDAIWAGSGNAAELTRYSRTGPADLRLRLPRGREIGPDAREAYRTSDLEHYSGSERIERRRLLEKIPFPDRLPAFGSIRTGTHGELWVQEFAWPRRDRHRWYVFDATGAQTGVINLPVSELLTVLEDRVILLLRDELGVERVQVHRFERSP